MKVVRKKLFYLSSSDRQPSESIQQWSMMFPDNLMNISQNEKIRMTMVYFSLLNSFQNINSNNNTCYVLINGTSYVLSLPVGNFSLLQIASNFATALNNLQGAVVFSFTIPSTSTYKGYLTYTGSLSSMTLYFTTASAPSSFNSFKVTLALGVSL